MTKKTLEKKQASTLPKTTEPSLWAGSRAFNAKRPVVGYLVKYPVVF